MQKRFPFWAIFQKDDAVVGEEYSREADGGFWCADEERTSGGDQIAQRPMPPAFAAIELQQKEQNKHVGGEVEDVAVGEVESEVRPPRGA